MARGGRKSEAGRAAPAPRPLALEAPGPAAREEEPGGRAEPRWSALLDRRLPLELTAVNQGHLELGLAAVVVARRAGAQVVCAHYIVDLLACGVLDCYGDVLPGDGFERYLLELDAAVPLDACPPARAAALVLDGMRTGERHGVAQPESLELWRRFLPPEEDPAPPYGPLPPPLAVADLLEGRGRGEGTTWSDERPAGAAVGRAGARDH